MVKFLSNDPLRQSLRNVLEEYSHTLVHYFESVSSKINYYKIIIIIFRRVPIVTITYPIINNTYTIIPTNVYILYTIISIIILYYIMLPTYC